MVSSHCFHDSDGVLGGIEERSRAEVDTLVEGCDVVAEEKGCDEGKEASDGGADGHQVCENNVEDEITEIICLYALHF